MSAPTVTPTLQRRAAQATHDHGRGFTTLAHLIDADVRREAYRHTRKASAPGIDGVTAQGYAGHLDENLHDRYERWRSGRYQAAPVERVWIEKADGGQRPSGTPTFADQIVQRAVARLLAARYEQDFSAGSYGVRPGRSPHAALPAWREQGRQEGRGWIVDAEVSGSVDSSARPRLREVLRQRGTDGRRVRLMGKGLRAGVMEAGARSHPETGVGQGGVISPVLAKVFLHQVLDEGLAREVRPRMQGRCVRLRCADDVVMGGERAADARRSMAVRPKRFARFGVSMHPEKTARIACSKPATRQGPAPGHGTFDFLGLTHDWTPSRRGVGVSKRRTASKRLRRTKQAWWRGCRTNRHAPLTSQDQMLCLKWRGHFRSSGIRGHFRLLEEVLRWAERAWRYWRSRRSRKSAIGWAKFQQLLKT